ncbi:MAG: FprA family A-type flavoprotein [Methanocellales archaeon]
MPKLKNMNWRNITQISKDVYWVGVRDWNRRLFDSLIPLPKGTTYNSYLIAGEKKALIDTVNPGFEIEFQEKISRVLAPSEIDFVVMNHAEPDHAGAIPYLMSINSKVKLITSSKGAKLAQIFYKVPQERIISIRDQENLDLGGKTLRFIEAPMLHWPETIFTYLVENKILFPCDFFGSHIASGMYDDEVEDLLIHAQRYFGEIMMPFRTMAQKALEKIKNLEIEMIAPSHGVVYKNPEHILSAYKKWANGETKQKATIVYVTMWGSTEKMIQPFAETLASEGIEIKLHNLAIADIGDVAMDLVDSRAIVLGTPAVLGGAHPLAVYAAYLVKALRPPLKFGAMLSSYGWSGGAVKNIQEILGADKIEIAGAIEVNGSPSGEDIARIIELSKKLASKIKETK